MKKKFEKEKKKAKEKIMEKLIRKKIKQLKKEVMTQIDGIKETLDRIESLLKKDTLKRNGLCYLEMEDIRAFADTMIERMYAITELKLLLRDAKKKKKHEGKN